jgi:hypothetical protein
LKKTLYKLFGFGSSTPVVFLSADGVGTFVSFPLLTQLLVQVFEIFPFSLEMHRATFRTSAKPSALFPSVGAFFRLLEIQF